MVSLPSTGYGKAIFFKFWLELASQIPVGSGAQRPVLMGMNPKIVVPMSFYLISLFGFISWFLHFVSLLLLTVSWWDLHLQKR